MRHVATRRFWTAYRQLQPSVRGLADRSFEILKRDPHHPSLHLKKVGRFWSARVGLSHRALAVHQGDALVWFWIGSHAEYDALISR